MSNIWKELNAVLVTVERPPYVPFTALMVSAPHAHLICAAAAAEAFGYLDIWISE